MVGFVCRVELFFISDLDLFVPHCYLPGLPFQPLKEFECHTNTGTANIVLLLVNVSIFFVVMYRAD